MTSRHQKLRKKYPKIRNFRDNETVESESSRSKRKKLMNLTRQKGKKFYFGTYIDKYI